MIEEIIKSHLKPEELFTWGFADLTGLLDPKFRDFTSGISIGRRLDDIYVDPVTGGPTLEYYMHYKEINILLETLSSEIALDLNQSGIESISIEPTVSTSDLDSKYSVLLRTDLSHKMVATRAGLGWIGKTDLLVTKDFGPRLRMVSILTKAKLKPSSKPVERSRCGTCNICVDLCPAGAANGKLWDITVDREDFFDPWKCRRQCAEFGRIRLGRDARVCGICVAVCPIGKRPEITGLH
ncbi:MAG: 4Fe-4S double cluster binding domain-containing protein [Bacteroidales bacterium]|jgi:epoxyqueuosine reductase QueG